MALEDWYEFIDRELVGHANLLWVCGLGLGGIALEYCNVEVVLLESSVYGWAEITICSEEHYGFDGHGGRGGNRGRKGSGMRLSSIAFGLEWLPNGNRDSCIFFCDLAVGFVVMVTPR